MSVYLTSRNVNTDTALEAARKITVLELKKREHGEACVLNTAIVILYIQASW